MKIHSTTVFLVAVAFFTIRFLLQQTQSGGGIDINGADAVATIIPLESSALNNLITQVPSRFVVQYANGSRVTNIGIIPSNLHNLVQTIPERFVIKYANGNRYHSTNYPSGLINDTISPEVTIPIVTLVGTNAVRLRWLSNEFAAHTVEYGTQSGNYTQTISDQDYYKDHEAIISPVMASQIYYYRLRNVDRNGNETISVEYTFLSENFIFLPIIKK